MTVPNQLLDSLTKSAKSLMKAVKRGDLAARARVQRVYRDLPESTLKLMQAQHVLAVELGYRSWAEVRGAPEADVRGAMGRVWKKRRLDLPTQARVREILEINGVTLPPDVRQRPINVLALYRITGGASNSLWAAQKQADENARRRQWAVELGHYSCGVENHQGIQIKRILRDEGIPFVNGHPSLHWHGALTLPNAYPDAYAKICEIFGPPTGAT